MACLPMVSVNKPKGNFLKLPVSLFSACVFLYGPITVVTEGFVVAHCQLWTNHKFKETYSLRLQHNVGGFKNILFDF